MPRDCNLAASDRQNLSFAPNVATMRRPAITWAFRVMLFRLWDRGLKDTPLSRNNYCITAIIVLLSKQSSGKLKLSDKKDEMQHVKGSLDGRTAAHSRSRAHHSHLIHFSCEPCFVELESMAGETRHFSDRICCLVATG